jgi:hypothetical protein
MSDDGREAALAGLERELGRLSRATRRLIVMQVFALCGLAGAELGLVWAGGGPFVWRDAWAILGLTVVGLLICGTRVSDWLYERRRDARELRVLRELDEALPLMVAIRVIRGHAAERQAASPEPPAAPTVH